MVASIDNALVIEFSSMVHEAAQQQISRYRPYVKVLQMSGDVWAYDGLGTVEMRELSGRNPKVVFDDIEHLRRKISRKRFGLVLPIDASDIRGSLLNPQNNYASAISKAAMRQYDRVIQAAAFADVLTGRDFGTTVTYANDGGLTVDATAGLTYEKLLEIKQNFMDNDVGVDQGERIVIGHTGAEHTRLMRENELTSGDFSRNFVVDKGTITQALGMDLVSFAANAPSPIIPVASSQRQLIAMSDRAIALGISKEMSIKIQERNDYHETTQVLVEMEIGAVRTEGKLIQRVSVTA
jgi:hypothetical protein